MLSAKTVSPKKQKADNLLKAILTKTGNIDKSPPEGRVALINLSMLCSPLTVLTAQYFLYISLTAEIWCEMSMTRWHSSTKEPFTKGRTTTINNL